MRLTVAIFAFLIPYTAVHGQKNGGPLSDRMRTMNYLMDDIARTGDSSNYPEGARKTRELRQHLIQAIALTPNNLTHLSEREKNTKLIEFHQLMARVIYLSASLERAFDASEGYEPESQSRKDDIKNLIHEIDVVSDSAHKRFRD